MDGMVYRGMTLCGLLYFHFPLPATNTTNRAIPRDVVRGDHHYKHIMFVHFTMRIVSTSDILAFAA